VDAYMLWWVGDRWMEGWVGGYMVECVDGYKARQVGQTIMAQLKFSEMNKSNP
jgi:hypothetical protein